MTIRLGRMGRLGRLGLAVWLVALLAACASGPLRNAVERDGPLPNPPADLVRVPDAEPKVEPIRSGGPNKPYDVLGHNYVPITQDAAFTERGLASWYGRAFHGKRTASGEVYNMYAMTAAHPTLPIPSYARIRNPANGREVVVRINDRGPFHAGRIVDLSYTAALKLDLLRGVAPVELQRITFEDIRTGAWRRGVDADGVRVAARDNEQEVRPAPSASAAVVAVPVAAVATVAATTQGAAEPESTPASDPGAATGTATTPAPAAASTGASAAADPVADAPVARAFTTPGRGFWVQLGAFRAREGAETFQKRVTAEMEWLSPLLAVFNDASMYRLQAGPYPSRDEARNAAERVRDALKLVPVIVERR